MEQGEASENVQQIPGYQLQHISQEPLGTKPRSNTTGVIHQHQLHSVQVEQQQEEQHPESPSNKRQQDNEENTLPKIQDHSNSGQLQEIHYSQKHESHEQQPPESDTTQIHKNSKQKVEQYLEPQTEDSWKPQIHENQKHQMQQNEPQHQDGQNPQAVESQEHQMQQNQEATTYSCPVLQSQQTSTPLQVTQPLSSAHKPQEKQSTQHNKETGKQQLSQEKSEEWYLTKQTKKRSRKLVGENQQRINYLVQASRAIALTDGLSTAGQSQKVTAAEVGSLATAVGRRCVLRLSPALKRCLCKGCGTALVYGISAKVRHRSRRQKHLVVTCLTCRTIKRFINNPRHELWYEQEEAAL